MTNADLPSTTKCWTQTAAVPRDQQTTVALVAESLKLETKPLPELKPQQVLIKVARCTINPNDLLHLGGNYGPTNDWSYPRPAGFEGSGTVVASAASWYLPQAGSRVAFYADGGGAFGEYVVCDANLALPIPDSVSFERAAASITNPVSVILMVDHVKARGHKIFVNTAAAGTVGRLMLWYATSLGLQVINVVHNESQVKMMKEQLRAKHVLNSSTPTFEKELASLMEETNCTFAYDCLSGTSPNTLLKAGPPGTVVSVYGSLISDEMIVEYFTLVDGKRLETFVTPDVLSGMWFWSILRVFSEVKRWMTLDNETIKVRKSYPLSDVPEALAEYAGPNKTDGKIQIVGNAA